MEDFFNELRECAERNELTEFCQRKILHGTPFVFSGREDDFYAFRRRIAQHFEIHYNDIVITGSAKLGFSPIKRRAFDLDSDIDVAIVSLGLFDGHLDRITDYQYQLREKRKAVNERELSRYHTFLEYVALGWILEKFFAGLISRNSNSMISKFTTLFTMANSSKQQNQFSIAYH